MKKLILVYALKTNDPNYLYTFYASRRLFEEAVSLQLDFSMYLAGNFIESDHEPQKTCLLMRGDFSYWYMRQLEKKGFTVINNSRSHLLCIDKLATSVWLKKHGWPHPKTQIYSETSLRFPSIVKPRFGKMGGGIMLLEKPEDITPQVSAMFKKHDYLQQEYIAESYGKDVRFFFAGFEKPFAVRYSQEFSAICVMRQGTGLLSNAHEGGRMTRFNPPHELAELAGNIFSASGLTYGTVDFLFTDNTALGFTVCELNSMPGFEELERASRANAARAILTSCIKYL